MAEMLHESILKPYACFVTPRTDISLRTQAIFEVVHIKT